MKFLYRMNSAPAGRYYTERGVKDRVPVIELDRKKEGPVLRNPVVRQEGAALGGHRGEGHLLRFPWDRGGVQVPHRLPERHGSPVLHHIRIKEARK